VLVSTQSATASVCVVGVERAGGNNNTVAIPAIITVTVETQDWWGVSGVGGNIGVAVALASRPSGSVCIVVKASRM
jgi:hypothetical protein